MPEITEISAMLLNSSANTSLQALTLADIVAALEPALRPRLDIDLLDSCDSTSSLLLARAEAGAPSGSVIITREQTGGRGRRGRPWVSTLDDSLTFSLLWRFPAGTDLSGLSLSVGVAVLQALKQLGIHGASLKWPNDVLLSGQPLRKLAGILVELAPGTHKAPAAVIGIGLNRRLPVSLPDEARAKAASLAEVLQPPPELPALLATLLAALQRQLQEFTRQGFAAARADWLASHAYQNQAVCLYSDFAPPLEGICRGVAEDGALLLETSSGVQRIISGEVSLRPRAQPENPPDARVVS